MELSERKKQILKAIVDDYVQTAEPVGSKAVALRLSANVSSATVRNEMAELEKLGYTFASAELEMVPSTYTKLDDEETAVKMQKMLDMFEDNDDIQNVWHNWDD